MFPGQLCPLDQGRVCEAAGHAHKSSGAGADTELQPIFANNLQSLAGTMGMKAINHAQGAAAGALGSSTFPESRIRVNV